MPILVVELSGGRRAGRIAGRVVIGRRVQDQIRLRDPAVGRVHAWIDRDANGHFFIADAGTASGTLVNDQRISGKQPLGEFDTVRIGPVKMWWQAGEELPAGAGAIDLRPRPAPPASAKEGISFDCACGAPLWVPWKLAGKSGRCGSCGKGIVVPNPGQSSGSGKTAGESKSVACGVCHGDILPGELTHRCPACGTIFHQECWTGNDGCSVYGCSQVGSLGQLAGKGDSPDESSNFAESFDAPQQVIPWAAILLAAAVIGALAGTMTFGATSLFVSAATLFYLFRKKPTRQRRILWLAIAVSIIGTLAGAAISYYWWWGVPWSVRHR